MQKVLERRGFLKLCTDKQVTYLLACRFRRTAARRAFLMNIQADVKNLDPSVIVAYAELTFDYSLEGKEEFARWCIQHSHPSVRYYGCSNLQFWGDAHDLPVLKKLATDESLCDIFDKPVSEMAMFAFCAIKIKMSENEL